VDLAMNEIFGPTPQGEGPTQGEPAVFARLAGCNLACGWCDSPYAWNWLHTKSMHPDKHDPAVEIRRMSVAEVVHQIRARGRRKAKRLVITGGEPLLQQKNLVFLTSRLQALGWRIEVETSGTIMPSEILLATVDQFNCSPKLSNSGSDNPKSKRIIPDVLRFLGTCPKANFKFVIETVKCAKEAMDLAAEFHLPLDRICFMPQARTKIEHAQLGPEVAMLARCHMVFYTSRQQVELHDDQRAV